MSTSAYDWKRRILCVQQTLRSFLPDFCLQESVLHNMFPAEDPSTVPMEARKKRLHPDGQNLSSSLPKRYFTVAEMEPDSSFRSDAGTVTCLGSAGKVQDRLIWRKDADDALNWECSMTSLRASEVSSTSAGVSSSVDCLLVEPTRERRELCHKGKSKGNFLTNLNPFESRRSDAELEVNSEVTLQGTSNIDYPVFSVRSDNEPSGESVARNVRYRDFRRNKSMVDGMPQSMPEYEKHRHKLREGAARHSDTEIEISDTQQRARYNMVKSCPSIADESGSSCGEPSEDLISEEERVSSVDADASRPNLEPSLQVDETEIQSARFPFTRGNCSMPLIETKREWERFVEDRSAESRKTEGLKELEKEGQTAGHDVYEYGSHLFNDNANDESHRPSYVLSSGRMSQDEVARLGRRPPTIDRDFEEYFSSLML